jgi:hypothetical protein
LRHHLKTTRASAAPRLAALALFAALAFASDASAFVGPRAPDSSASSSRTSNASSAQRRRRRVRRRAADALLPGVWGGSHIRFEASDGGAEIEFDCARASVMSRIVVDAAGRFDADATYYQESGARPVMDETPHGYPVRLTGRVGGSLMSLTIMRGGESLGTFSLARGREPRLTKCM